MKFVKKEKNGISYYELDILKEAGFKNMFTTVNSGVSFGDELNFSVAVGDRKENVTENFRRALACMDSICENAVMSRQTHSDVIITADKSFGGCGILREPSFSEADGLITDEKNLSLVVFYADCVPVLLADINKKVIGAVHSGWRGTEKNILSKAIEKMCTEKNCNKKDIIVAVGPCIGMCHYEVSEEIYNKFIPAYKNDCGKKENGKFYLDLGKIVCNQAENAGIPKENTAFSDKCTFCNDEFYSYRRQNKRAGRMAAFIRYSD